MATKTREKKDLRWDLRVAESDDELVRTASYWTDMTPTSFIRFAALREARCVLADRTAFELDRASWQQFTELLDRPAQVPAGLRKLYAKPSVFE
jgi:uncharacterized protein (DUF1778 family)